MTTFLSDIVLAGANDIQFKNTSGANTGKIESDGNDLVLSNAVGDILLGDGASDVYIGDGTNSVDVRFEVSGAISAESGAQLTLGGAGGTLALGSAISLADYVSAISGTGVNTIDIGTSVKPFKNIYAAHHVGGSSINYATSRGWVERTAPMSGTNVGEFGGNFTRNGATAENAIVWGLDPFNNKALLWKCILNTSDDNDDGGWNKEIVIPANNDIGYLSYVYFKVDFTPDSDTQGSKDGTVYLGAGQVAGETINVSDGSSNTNPYFTSSSLFAVNNGGPVVANRWYLMVGILQAYNNPTTDTNTFAGVYDVETGEKVSGGAEFKMGNNTTGQKHRAYIYYDQSTDNENAYFWNPGFHAIDGSEPKIQDLVKRQVYLDDNVKAAFGTGNDLEIYHDGSNSYIKDSGPGSLYTYTDAYRLTNAAGNENMIWAAENSFVKLYYDNSAKLETVTGGVEITGELQADSLDIDGNADISGALTLGTSLAVAEGGTGVGTSSSWLNSNSFANFTASSADWDTIDSRGSYRLQGGTNNPFGTSHSTGIVVTQDDDNYGFQLFAKGSGNNQEHLMYRYRGSSWDNWQTIVTKTFGDGRYLLDSEVTNLADVKAFDTSDYATAAQGTLATNALPTAGGTMSGAIAMGSQNITGGGTITGTTLTGTSLDINGSADISGNLTGVDTLTATTFSGDLNGTINTATTAATQSASNNSTKVATTAYVDAQVATVVDSAPGTLDTLNELAAALGDDASFSTTVTNSIAAKLPLAGGTMSGAIAMGNQNITGVNNIQANGDVSLQTSTGEYALYGSANAQTQLYHNGIKKFETTSGGIDVTGEVQGDSLDINGNADISGVLSGGKVFPRGVYLGTTTTGFLIQTSITTNAYAMMHGTIKLEQFNSNSFQTIEFSATTQSNGTVGTKAGVANVAVTIKLFNYNSVWYVWVPTPSTYTTCTAYIGLANSYQGQTEPFNEVLAVTNAAVPSSGVSNSVDLVTLVKATTAYVDAKTWDWNDITTGTTPTFNQNTTGSSGSCTGNASTATTLEEPRAINGVDFNGSTAITITAAATTLTGTSLKSTVVGSSLTSVGEISTGSWRGTAISGTYIANDTINSQHYADGSIDTAHIADDAVTENKLANTLLAEIDANTAKSTNRAYFEFRGYSTSDGTNYEMAEVMTDPNAPFEHNTSTGSDGLTAQTIQTVMRGGGVVMPYTGVLKKFTGWVTSAGSGTINIGLFKFTPTDDSAGNLTPVQLVNEQTTSSGNAIMNSFSETSSFDAGFTAGDIVYPAVLGINTKALYFNSTLEVEWS